MENLLNFFYIILIFLVGFVLSYFTAKKIRSKIIYFLFLEHMLFSYIYYLYSLSYSADSNMYYAKALEQPDLLSAFGTDTQFIIFITTFFAKYLRFSKLAVFFAFGLFGFIGFRFFILMLEKNYFKLFGFNVMLLVLLLPEFHFWTSALGKDSLIFMAIMMFFYSLLKVRKRFFLAIISLLIVGLIRPHIGFIMLAAVNAAFIFQSPTKINLTSIFIIVISILGLILSIPFLQAFLRLDQFDYESINKRLEFYSGYSAEEAGGLNSYIDVSSYSLPLKMISYLFRPIFYDARSFLQLMASIENLFLVILIIKWLKLIKFNIIRWFKSLNVLTRIMFLYVIFGWVILSAGMYNLGLASRQKYMLLPIFFILIFKNSFKDKRKYIEETK